MNILAGVLVLFAALSGLAKVGFGFGAGIVLNPILTLFVSSAAATTLLAPILWFSNFTGARAHRKYIQWPLIKKMLPMALLGTLIGSLTLTYVNDQILKPSIGILAIMMGFLLFLSRKKTKTEEHLVIAQSELIESDGKRRSVLYPLGAFASGFIGAAANSGGLPLIVLFLQDRSITKNAFTANIAVLLAIMDTIKIISYLILGTLSIKNLLLVVLYIPFILLGGLAGKWIHKKVSEKSFFLVVHTMIFLTGILLLY